MLKSRISHWTKLKCYRNEFHIPCQESYFLKDYKSYVHRCLNHVCHIHSSVKMKNFVKIIRKPTDTEAAKGALCHTHIKQLLQNCKSVANQIEVFHSHVKLSEEDVSSRQAACQEIEKLFKSHFPSSSLNLIGSTVTGLGLKGCDVDLSFQFAPVESDTNDGKSDDVVLSNDIDAGKVPIAKFPTLPSKQQLRFLRKILIDAGLGGTSPTIIPGRCPILSFSHNNLSCDMAVNNKSALNGTNLMLLCRKLDERVASLFQVLTYWGKHSKFIGGPLKFKTYALFLIMVYFLQTRKPPILLPVQKMLDKTEFVKNQGNWSYDVCKYLGQFEASQNSQSLEELLEEFFLFYRNFDFDTVISPLTGDLIDMSVFHNLDASGDCKFELNSISIQDPLNLHWNVTTMVKWKYLKFFVKGLQFASMAYQDNFYMPSSDQNWGLLKLFDNQWVNSLPKGKH